MQIKEKKIALKKAISLDLGFGLDWLESWTLKSSDAYNEFLLHRSNYQTTKNDLRKQLLDSDTANRKFTTIRYALMNWIDQVDEKDLDQEFDHADFQKLLYEKGKEIDSEKEQTNPSKRKWKVGLLLVFLLGAIAWWGYSREKSNTNYLNTTFDLNVIIYGDSAKSKIIRNGTLLFLYNGKPESFEIGQNGRVVWSNLSNDVRNTMFYVNPKVSDYQTKQLTIQIPAVKNVIEIILQPIQYQTKLRGNVVYNGKSGKYLLVDIQGIETMTDEKGDFEQMVPYKKGTEVRIRVFKDNEEVYNGTEMISEDLIPIPIKSK